MNSLNALLAVAGVTVTLLVIVAMILLTPKGAVPSTRAVPEPATTAPPLVPVADEA